MHTGGGIGPVPHETALIATIAIGLAFALLGGYIAVRVHLPPLVGYLVAGIAVGPFTPGFVADPKLAPQLAEIGVMLLMFGVGMHFSLRDLLAVRAVALPGALAQIVLATALGIGVAMAWGWSLGAGLVFGLALSVASTVVLLRALEARGLLESLAEPLGGQALDGSPAPGNLWLTLGLTLGKIALFAVLMLMVGVRVFPWLLKRVEDTGSRELFTLAVVALALGVAFGSAKLFGVSFALGAFFAGMVINESDLSHRAATDTQPLQDAFAGLFFVAVGMLFDPEILFEQPLKVLAVLAIIVVGKSLAALGIVLALQYPLGTALSVSAALAQIGEFSFILAGLGVSLGLLPPEGHTLILAGAILSITLNPLLFNLVSHLQIGRPA
jgi:monovalent cation:H+ antiporter-2, CPA2 family